MKAQFPHFPRIFTARVASLTGKALLWMLLIALILFNTLTTFTTPFSYSNKLFDIFAHPFAWNNHVSLAQDMWQHGSKNQAMQELILASELTNNDHNSNILGLSTTPSSLLETWKNEPAKERQEKEYWQIVITTHPDYRDAFVQLAALSYRQQDIPQTKAYLLKAQLTDPNNLVLNRLADFVSKTNN